MGVLQDIVGAKANKAVAAFVVAAVGFATEVVLSVPDKITSVEWLHAGVGLAVALGVYTIGNRE